MTQDQNSSILSRYAPLKDPRLIPRAINPRTWAPSAGLDIDESVVEEYRPTRAPEATVPATDHRPATGQHPTPARLIGSRAALRRAMLLREVLGPPVSSRRPDER
jgi:hypothetical protein